MNLNDRHLRAMERSLANVDQVMRQVDAINASRRFVDMDRVARQIAFISEVQQRHNWRIVEAIEAAQIGAIRAQEVVEQYERLSQLGLDRLVSLFNEVDEAIRSTVGDPEFRAILEDSLAPRMTVEENDDEDDPEADLGEEEEEKEETSADDAIADLYEKYRELSEQVSAQSSTVQRDDTESRERLSGLAFAVTVGRLLLDMVRFALNG